MDLESISGIGEWTRQERKVEGNEEKLFLAGNGKAFLVERPTTIEVRCDQKLGKILIEKYESVMESRYFGRGGVEIVKSGQLSGEELDDLVRLSYNLTVAEEDV